MLEYSKNYRKKIGSLCNYYREEPNNSPLNDDNFLTINYNADPITNSASFKKVLLQKKGQMQIKKMVKTPSKETQRLKKILKLLFH